MYLPVSQKHLTRFCVEYNKHHSVKLAEPEFMGILASLVKQKDITLFQACNDLINKLI